MLLLCRLSSADEASEPSVVDVMLVGSVADEPTVGQRISSWFDEAKFRVRVQRVSRLDTERVLSPQADGSVQVWVTLADSEARVYFATVPPGRDAIYSLRVLALEQGLDEIGAERLSQVIHMSAVALFEGRGEHARADVEKMLQGERVETGGAEPAPPTKPVANPRPKREVVSTPQKRSVAREPGRSLLSSRFGLGYGASYRSVEGTWHGPRGRAGLSLGVVGVDLSVQGYLPHSEELPSDSPELRLRWSGIGIELGPMLHHQPLTWLELEYSLSLSVDVVSYEPLSALDARVTTGNGDVEMRPNAVAKMRGVFGSSGLRWALVVQCGLALNRTHYYLGDGLARREVGRPSRILPLLALEATF